MREMKERVGAVQCSGGGGGGGVVVVKALLLWQVVTCNHQSLDLLCGLSRVGKLKHLPRQSTRRRPGQPGARPRPSLIVLHVITSPLLCHLLTIHRRSHACARPDCPYLLLFCAPCSATHTSNPSLRRERLFQFVLGCTDITRPPTLHVLTGILTTASLSPRYHSRGPAVAETVVERLALGCIELEGQRTAKRPCGNSDLGIEQTQQV